MAEVFLELMTGDVSLIVVIVEFDMPFVVAGGGAVVELWLWHFSAADNFGLGLLEEVKVVMTKEEDFGILAEEETKELFSGTPLDDWT